MVWPISTGPDAPASTQLNARAGRSDASTSCSLSQTQSSLESWGNCQSCGVQSFLGDVQDILKKIWNWVTNLFGGATANVASKERVHAIFHSDEHRNEIVNFEHDGHIFEIRVINNRNGLDIGHIHYSAKYILACLDEVPETLVTQIESLTPEGVGCNVYFNMIVNGQPAIAAFQ